MFDRRSDRGVTAVRSGRRAQCAVRRFREDVPFGRTSRRPRRARRRSSRAPSTPRRGRSSDCVGSSFASWARRPRGHGRQRTSSSRDGQRRFREARRAAPTADVVALPEGSGVFRRKCIRQKNELFQPGFAAPEKTAVSRLKRGVPHATIGAAALDYQISATIPTSRDRQRWRWRTPPSSRSQTAEQLSARTRKSPQNRGVADGLDGSHFPDARFRPDTA